MVRKNSGKQFDLFEDKPRTSPGVPNLNVGTAVPLSFMAFGRVIKPPAVRVVVYFSLTLSYILM